MAVNLQGFKAFAGIYSPGVPAKKAIGLLTVSRTDPASQNIIEIPAETRFSIFAGLNFKSLEDERIHESASFIPVTVIAEIGRRSRKHTGPAEMVKRHSRSHNSE